MFLKYLSRFHQMLLVDLMMRIIFHINLMMISRLAPPPQPHPFHASSLQTHSSLHVGLEGRALEWVGLRRWSQPTNQHQPIYCLLFSVFGPRYFEFDFIFDFIYKLQMADILVGLRCLQSFSLALLTLSIRFFSSIYTFFEATHFLVYLWLLK